jgi:hypothetical protein
VFTVTFEETGSELIASKGNRRNKINRPIYNRMSRRTIRGSIYSEKDTADAKLEA